jgi:hypothetical protein
VGTGRLFALFTGFAITSLLGGTSSSSNVPVTDTESTETSYSISIATYLAQHGRDYASPTFTLDRGVLHLESRYNYESIKTGSVWIGYNFAFGDKLSVEVAPMLGGVFGEITGIAPGYTISASWKSIEFFTQGEYLFDSGTSSGNFFYTWTELSYSAFEHFRVGLVLDRTKALGENFDIRRGPLVGFNYKNLDLTAYWLSPGSPDATFIFAVTASF